MDYEAIATRPGIMRLMATIAPKREIELDARTMYDIGLTDIRPTKSQAAPKRLPRYF
ncbi:MAG: hypothetical protein AAGA87_00155 [Pseudomonadota bacterium]